MGLQGLHLALKISEHLIDLFKACKGVGIFFDDLHHLAAGGTRPHALYFKQLGKRQNVSVCIRLKFIGIIST